MKFGTAQGTIAINTPSRTQLFRTLAERFSAGDGFALATLNLDHLTKLPRDAEFAAAYQAHDLIVADGRPVVWLTRLSGQQSVELVPGSDLILPLCDLAAKHGVSVALVGSSEAALAGAAAALQTRVPDLRIDYVKSPPLGFDPSGAEAASILAEVAASGARLCLIALGAPKQELFAARGRTLAPTVGFASIGAGLDFLSGHQTRAPAVMRKLPLEWLWRIFQSPARMVPRYAKCFAILPALTLQAWRQR